MRNFYKILIFVFLANVNYSFAANNKDRYPTGITIAGGATYCQNTTSSNLTVTITTTTCTGAIPGGVTTNIPITVTWYQNSSNSTSGGTLVQTTASTTATTTYTYAPPTLIAGTFYYYATVTWAAGVNCATAGSITTASTQTVIILSGLIYTSSSTDQYIASNIDLSCTEVTNAVQEIKIVMNTGGTCASTITQFNLTTAGSTNAATDITRARIYYTGQTQGYNAFNFFGSVNNPNGAFTVNGSQPLLLGAGTYYFYVCYDIASTATSGDVVDATLSSFNYNGSLISNMSPNPTVSVTLGTGACHATPDLPNPTSNFQTVTAGSLIIPMDNSHQNLWKSNGVTLNGFNIKAYGLVRALLMQDIPVKWIIKSGKTKDSSDFSAIATRLYPTNIAAALQYFKAGEFEVDTTYLARSVYPGEQTATQVISTFATRWKVAVYKLSSNTSVDVRYTLSHRPKIALFNNGGFQSVQLAMLDSSKVWTSPNVDTALSAGSFSGLAECFTFCSESHWDNTTTVPPAAGPINYPADTSVVRPVYQFIEEGGNFLAQCAGIDKYENQMQPTRHFQSSHGVVDQGTQFTNYYGNADMAFSQFQGTVVSRSGTVASFELSSADTSSWHPEMYECVHSGKVTGDTVIAAGVHLGNPDSVGGNVFYLAGHDYQAGQTGTLNYINGVRMYLNAVFVPANRPDPTPLQAGSNVSICSGQSTTLGGSPTGPSSGGGTVYTWTSSSTNVSLNNSSSANPIASPTVTTTYTVFVNSSGCAYSPASVVVTVTPTTAITSQSTATQTQCVSGTFTAMLVTATGTGTLTYQWYSNASASNSGGTLIVGAISSTYTPPATVAGTTYYYCIVSGTCSSATSAVSGAIIVTPTTAITSQSTATQTQCVSGSFSAMSVTATGTGTLTYQWYSNASASNSGGTLIIGATSSTYTPLSTVAGTTYYYCIVSGTCGSATSAVSGAIIVTPATSISSQSTATQTQCIGGSFSAMSVTATGTGTLTYQWYSNASASNSGGTLIGGATSSTYTPPATSVGTTYYYCIVSGTCANATSAVSGAIIVNPATIINSQSTATQTQCIGGSFSAMSVSATGTGTLTYQWYSNASASNSGGTLIVGATSSTYTPPATIVGTTYYYCVVGSTCSALTSAVSGAIIVTPATSISSQSTATQTQCVSGAFSAMSVTATGTAPLTYQWYSNASASNSGGTLIVGATSSTYTPPATVAGTTYYYCIVSGTCNTATSAVSGAIIVTPATSISSQSTATQTQCIGGSFTAMSVTATGTGVLTYQWYSNVSASNSGGTLIGGATSSTYTPPATVVGTTYYYCIVSSSCANATSAISGAIIVTPATSISSQSTATQTQCVGASFSALSVTATGTAPLTYQWYSNASASNSGGTLIVGATSFSYTPPTTIVGTSYYYCIVSGTCSSATSAVSGAIIVTPATIISSQSTATQTQCIGGSFTAMSVTATGTGTLTYQWYSNASASNSGGTLIGGATSSTYTPPATLVGTTYYYCIVGSSCANTTSAVSGAIIVTPATSISSQSTATQTQCVSGAFSAISVTATGTAPLTYQWYSNASASNSGGTLIGGATSSSYTPPATLVGTTYYYCIVSGTCNSSTSAVSGAMIVNPATSISSQSTATQTQCIGGSFSPMSVTATGTGTLTYQWYSNVSASNSGGTLIVGATSSTYTPPATSVGTTYYYCIVGSTCANTTSAVSGAIIVTPATSINSQSTATQTQCVGGSFSAMSITATGTATLTYQWYSNASASNSGGASIGVATASIYTPPTIVAGTTYYYCIVSGPCGNVTSAVSGAIIVTPATSITSQSTATQTQCAGGAFSAISVSATGTGTLTYQWYSNASASNSGGTLISGATSSSYTPSAAIAGTTYYYCIVSGTCGSATSAVSGSFIVNPIPASPTASNNGPICAGTTLNLNATVVAGATYTWSGPNGFTSLSQDTSITNATTAATGTYSVYATVSGCTSSAGTTPATVKPVPTTPTATNNGPICAGATLTLTTGLVAGATYAWNGPGFTSTSQIASITNATTAASGTYSITVTVGGCGSSGNTTIATVNPIPVSPTASSNTPLCIGSTLNLNATTVAGATYAWIGPNSFSSTSQTPTLSGVVVADGGTYSVTATVSGCTSPEGTTLVVINPPPAAPTVTSNSPVCSGNTLSLHASNITGASYSWTGPNTFTSTNQNPNITSVTTAAAGTYSVNATVPGCATSPNGTITVVVNQTPASPAATSPSPICSGSSLNLTASTVPGTTYTWTGPNSFKSISQDTSILNSTTAASGTYTVVASANGCNSSNGTVSVVVNQTPPAPTVGSNSPICLGGAINLTASTVTSATYAWSGPNGFTSTSQNPNIPVSVIADSGIYSVNATILGCTGPNGTVDVSINPPPAAPVAGSNSPICAGTTLNLTASTVTNAAYSWTGPNTFTSSTQNPNISSVTTAASGTYSVTAKVPGCVVSSAGTVSVTVNPIPATPTATSNSPVCTGSNLNLMSSTIGGATYKWTGPNSFVSISQDTSISNVILADAGTYSVTATANGCTGSAGTVLVTVDVPAVVNAGTNQTVCANNDVISLNGSSSTGSAQWSSSGTGAFTPSNTTLNATYTPSKADTTAGSVILTLTSKNNGACSPVTSNITITFTHAPYVNAGPDQTVCGNNDVVTLNGSFTTSTGAVWSTSGSGVFAPNNTTMNATYTPSSADTAAGSITLTLTSTGNGLCSVVSDGMKITITHAPNVNAGSNVSVCKNNANVLLSGTSSTGSGVWNTSGSGTFSPNANTLNATYIASSADTAAGSVTLTLTSGSNGTCIPVNKSITVTYTPIPKVNAGPDVTACANNDAIILNGTSATGSGQWSTSGSGTFTPNNTTLNATYIPSNADTTTGSVTLTLASTNNGTCSPVSDQLVVNFTHAPTANAGSNASVCSNNANVILNGSFTIASGATWSTSGSGTFTPNNTTMNATYSPSSADTAAKSVTITLTTTGNGQCNAVSSSMTITYTIAPHVEAGPDTKVCLSSPDYTLSGYSSTGTGTWTTLGTGTFSPNTNTLGATYKPSTADTSAKTATLILTSTNNVSCNPVSDTIVLTYTKTPVVTAGSNQTVCANNDDVSLNATSSTGTGKWTSNGTGTFSPNNTTLNATYIPSSADTASGSVKLTFTATGGCNPTASSITITITHAPYVNSGPDQAVCRNNANVTLSGIVGGATTTGIWSTSGTGTFNPDNLTLNSTYIPSTADTTAGSVKLVLTSTGNGTCNAVTDTMMITYTKIPVVGAGSDQTVCANNDSVQLAGTSTSGSGQWSSSGTGSFSPNNNTSNAIYIPSNADTTSGSVTLTFTSTNNGGCTPVADQMVITINHAPVVSAGPDQSVCANNANTDLTGSVSNATGGQWGTTGSGIFTPSNTALNTTYVPSAADTTAGSVKLFLVTIGNGLCKATTDTMVLTITHAPNVNAGGNASVCNSSPDYTLNGSSSTGSGQWSTLGDGSFSPNNTTLNATYIPGTADTTSGNVKIVLASTGNGNCSAVTDTMIIRYDKRPKDNAGTNVTVCANNDSISLSGSSSTGSGQWISNGSGAFVPNSNTLNAIYVPSSADTGAGAVTLKLTTTNNGACAASNSQFVATITSAPYANAGIDQSICGNADAVLSGSINSVASGAQWSTLGSGTFSPNNSTLNATYIPSAADTSGHSVKLVLTTTGNGQCKAATDTMLINISPGPRVNAGGDVTVCLSNPDYTLNGSSSTGAGIWSTTNGSGTFSPNVNTLNATYMPSSADTAAHTVTLVLTSSNNGGCSASSDTVVLTYSTVPTANAGPDQTLCANNATVSLSGASGTGSGIWSTNGSGTFSPDNTSLNTTYIPSNADTTAGTVTLTLTTTGGCGSVPDNMTVTFTPAPFANAGTDQFACRNNPDVTLNGYVGGGASTGSWTTLGSGTFTPNNAALNATYVPSTADTMAGSVKLVLTTTNNGTCNATSDTMVINFTAPPSVNAGADESGCANNSVALNGVIIGGSGTGIWSTANGTGVFSPNNSTLTASYIPSNADTLAKNIVLVLTSTNNGNCNAITDTMVVTVSPGPIVNAGADQTVCANNANVTLSGSVANASGGQWSSTGSGTFTPSNTSLNATYIPSSSDITSGSIELVLASIGNGLCTKATDTMKVIFSPSPRVNAGADIYVCTGNTTASLNGSVSGGATTGMWSTLGSGTFSPDNVTLNATYNLSTVDTIAKTVKLVLTSTNNGSCISVTDTVVIRINPIPIANVSADTTVCASSASVAIHGNVTGGSGTGMWSTLGSGTFTPNDSTLNANYVPTSADTSAHSVKLILTTTKACMVSTDTMVVFFNSAPVVNAGPNQVVCSNNASVVLAGSVSNASGGKWITTGGGMFAPNDSTLNATYTPSASDITTDSVKLVLVSSGNGLCTAISDTMKVTFSPSPSVSAGSDIFVCTGNTTASLNGSVSGGATAGTWTTLGSGTFTPNNTTLNATYNLSSADTAAKTVKLVLTSTNNGGCLSVSDTVLIKITPIPTVTIGADTTVCANNNNIPIHATVSSGSGIWKTLGTGTFMPNDSTQNAHYVPGTADTAAKSVKLVFSATHSCSPVSDTMMITFSPAPKDNAGTDQAICAGSNVILKGTVALAAGGKWSGNGSGIFTPNDSALNAVYVPSLADVTTGKVTIVLTTTGNGACSASTDTMIVTIQSKPVANFKSSTACLNSTVSFTDESTVSVGSISAWNWNLGNNTSVAQNPTDNYNISGTQTITLIVSTSAGCSDTISRSIFVNPLPTALFTVKTSCPDSAQFTDNSIVNPGAISAWNWKFGDSSTSALQNPLHVYPINGTYITTLMVTSDSGCSASHSDTLTIDPCNNNGTIASAPGVPTAFTPNGDGNNDILYVRGGPFSLFDFRVFDQWGTQIFQANVQSEGWDGKFHGAVQPEGTFVWTLTGTTVDGKQVKMTGNVTILR